MLLFVVSAVTGPGGITMRKPLACIGIGIAIIFMLIGQYIQAHIH